MSLQAIALRFYLRYWFKRRLDPNAPVSVLRANVDDLVQRMPKPPPGVTVTPTSAGGVPAEWVAAPGHDARRVILYCHGGGYASGSPSSVRDLAWRLSEAVRCRVLVTNYRLAPEHPFPAAIEDTASAYRRGAGGDRRGGTVSRCAHALHGAAGEGGVRELGGRRRRRPDRQATMRRIGHGDGGCQRTDAAEPAAGSDGPGSLAPLGSRTRGTAAIVGRASGRSALCRQGAGAEHPAGTCAGACPARASFIERSMQRACGEPGNKEDGRAIASRPGGWPHSCLLGACSAAPMAHIVDMIDAPALFAYLVIGSRLWHLPDTARGLARKMVRMAKVFASEVITIRRRTAILGAGLLILAVNLFALVAQLSHVAVAPFWFGQLCTWAAVGLGCLYNRNAWPIRQTTRLIANGQGIWLDSKLTISRESITSGQVVPGAKPTVRIVRGFRAGLDIQLGTPEDVLKLIDALGLGVSVAVARFGAFYGGTHRMWIRTTILVVAAVILNMFLVPILMGTRLPLLALAGVPAAVFVSTIGFMIRSRARIVVGADGLLVSRPGTKEFVPYGEISSVTRDDDDVTVSRRGRPPLRLGSSPRRHVGSEYQADMLFQRIEDARATCVGRDVGTRVAALVARGNRSPREWLQAIHALLRDPGYREAALLPEHMWRIVEDPSGDAATRAGAATALASSLDDEGRGRLRLAARACAAPRLRVAFETAADAETEAGALEEALARLVRDQDPAPRNAA